MSAALLIVVLLAVSLAVAVAVDRWAAKAPGREPGRQVLTVTRGGRVRGPVMTREQHRRRMDELNAKTARRGAASLRTVKRAWRATATAALRTRVSR